MRDNDRGLEGVCNGRINVIEAEMGNIVASRSSRVADAHKKFRDAVGEIQQRGRANAPILADLAKYVTAVRMRTHDEMPAFAGLREAAGINNLRRPGLYEFVAWGATKVGVSFNVWERTLQQLAVRDPAGSRVAKHKHVYPICVFDVDPALHYVPFATVLDALESYGILQSVRVRPNHGAGRPGLSGVGLPRRPPLLEDALLLGGRDVYGLVMTNKKTGDVGAVLAVQDGIFNLRLIHPPSWVGRDVVKGAASDAMWRPHKSEERVLGVFLAARWVDLAPKPAFNAERFCGAALVARKMINNMARANLANLQMFMVGNGALLSAAASDGAEATSTDASGPNNASARDKVNRGEDIEPTRAHPPGAAASVCTASAQAVKAEMRRQGLVTADDVALYAYAVAEVAASGVSVEGTAWRGEDNFWTVFG